MKQIRLLHTTANCLAKLLSNTQKCRRFAEDDSGTIFVSAMCVINPFKPSGVKWLHFKVLRSMLA